MHVGLRGEDGVSWKLIACNGVFKSERTLVDLVDPSRVLDCERERRRVVDRHAKHKKKNSVSGMGIDHAGVLLHAYKNWHAISVAR